MKKVIGIIASFALVPLFFSCKGEKSAEEKCINAAQGVIERTIGKLENVSFKTIPTTEEGLDRFEIEATGGLLSIGGSSPSAICYAMDRYLREACGSMICWSGSKLDIPEIWPDWDEEAVSPYELRYFLNVCTFGYTTPYWGWERWSKEIDWMALHGVNMPLASVAAEAIAKRVWLKLGLEADEIDSFFTGAAHLPWHRMGNLNRFDGPLDDNWHNSQIKLQHKILDRMRELGMEPVAPAFAGFIPPALMKKHPEIQARQLTWGGFPLEDNACVLSPDSPWFTKIGKLFVREWEKEFGKAKYWLSDSFNEMKLPVEEGDAEGKHKLLAEYGKAIYNSISAGDSDAIWVTQGWTFGYQHDFWDPESLKAMLSGVPDDKMIIIDLGNDYPKWVWHTEQTWKVQEGFHGKKWIFSYVPNFGGKVLPTGDLDMYATASAEALASEYSKNLVGFGSAPEGLENNEIVYELLADMGWTRESIDIDRWLESYCRARYGFCDNQMREAWKLLHKSAYSSLYSYPRFTWQTVTHDRRRVSRHGIDDDFGKAVKIFLSLSDKCDSPLYFNDAVEFSALYLAELADRHYEKALKLGRTEKGREELGKTVAILSDVDRLLASHPLHRLDRWISDARGEEGSALEKDRRESNAKRLITTWGGWQEDYAARFWSGLIRDYYIPRLEIHFSEKAGMLDEWEEEWINTPYHSNTKPFDSPLEVAKELIANEK